MKVRGRISRRNDTLRSKHASPAAAVLEGLEPRLMLSAADWTGTWNLNGVRFVADTGPNDAGAEHQRQSYRMTVGDNGDGTFDAVVDNNLFVLEDFGDELRADLDGYDDNNYFEGYLRIVEIAPNAAFVLYGEGVFDSDSKTDLQEGAAYGALATRGSVAIAQRPWEGEYQGQAYDLNVEDDPSGGSVKLEYAEFELDIEDAGGGWYRVVHADGNDELFQRVGNSLFHEEDGPDVDGYSGEFVWVFRAPADTLWYVAGGVEFDADITDLWAASASVGALYPAPGSEYRPDLVGEIDISSVPNSVLAGSQIRIPVTIMNQGNAQAKGKADVEIYVCQAPQFDGSETLLTELQGLSINLNVDRDKTFTAKVDLPAHLPNGDYYLLAEIDAWGGITELDTDNNEIASNGTFELAEAFVDLTGQIGSKLRMPHSVVSGDGTKIKLPVEVRNEGNVPVAKGQKIDIDVAARPVGGGDDVPVTSILNQSVSNLKPGAVKKLNLNVTLPTGLDGEYRLVAQIDAPTPGDVAEKYEDNNEAVTPASIEVAEGYVDLIAAIGTKARLPSAVVSGGGTKVVLPIELTNMGNVRLDKAQKIDVGIYARPVGASDASTDRFLTAVTGQPVPNLKPMAVKKLNAQVVLNEPLDGDYLLVAHADDPNPGPDLGAGPGQVVEKDEDNNQASTASPIAFAEGFVDLTGTVSTKAKLPSLLVAGDGTKIKLPVEVRNEGNVPIEKSRKIAVGVVARPVGGGDDVAVGTFPGQSVSGLKPGAVKKLNLTVTLPAGLSGDHLLVAQIDSPTPGQVDEKFEDNNEAVAPVPIAIARDFFDLTGFDNVGAWWDYQATSGGAGGPATGTISSTVTANGQDRYRVVDDADTLGGSFVIEGQSFTWRDGDDGAYLDRRTQEIDIGSIAFDFDSLLVAPDAMALRKKSTDSAPVDGTFEIDYIVNGNADLTGTATSTWSLSGYETVTVPAGTFQAAKISLSLKTSTAGDLNVAGEVFSMKLTTTETYTLWAAPDVGIVKSVNKLSVGITLVGEGGAKVSGVENRLLSDYGTV